MILIACVDDNMGLLFNHRRQSRDRGLCRRLLALTAGRPLWMSAYSAPLFPADAPGLRIDPDFLQKAGADDFCFLEEQDPRPYLPFATTVILYRWNRSYPADLYFPALPAAQGWQLRASSSFPGTSHSKITEEIYSR